MWFVTVQFAGEERRVGTGRCVPVMEHKRRSDGVSLSYWLSIPFCAGRGSGMVSVIGLWNFLRRGSTVTIGETATRLPNIVATASGGTGCAWKQIKNDVMLQERLLDSTVRICVPAGRL